MGMKLDCRNSRVRIPIGNCQSFPAGRCAAIKHASAATDECGHQLGCLILNHAQSLPERSRSRNVSSQDPARGSKPCAGSEFDPFILQNHFCPLAAQANGGVRD